MHKKLIITMENEDVLTTKFSQKQIERGKKMKEQFKL